MHAKLAPLWDDLKKMGLYDKALIVLTADHGSRIFLTVPTDMTRGRLTRADFVDTYGAFLAVKKNVAEIGQGKIERAPTPLLRVIGETFEMLSPEEARDPSFEKVYLQKAADRTSFEETSMPDY